MTGDDVVDRHCMPHRLWPTPGAAHSDERETSRAIPSFREPRVQNQVDKEGKRVVGQQFVGRPSGSDAVLRRHRNRQVHDSCLAGQIVISTLSRLPRRSRSQLHETVLA